MKTTLKGNRRYLNCICGATCADTSKARGRFIRRHVVNGTVGDEQLHLGDCDEGKRLSAARAAINTRIVIIRRNIDEAPSAEEITRLKAELKEALREVFELKLQRAA